MGLNKGHRAAALAACISVALGLSAPMSAQTIFFGENQNPGGAATGAPVDARNDFLARLSGVSTESFESFAVGSSPEAITFTGSAGTITASFSPGTGTVRDSSTAGRFATDGANFFSTSSIFEANFSTPVAAFGFFGTDVGDFDGQLTVELFRVGGSSSLLTVPNTINAADSSLLFFGVIDTANPFTRIRFGNTSTGSDTFGFDQLTIGDIGQVTGAVPEPGTWAMLLLGFAFIGGALRSRRDKLAGMRCPSV